MMPSPVRPPWIPSWFVDLFASGKQAESIPGDLLEEFSELASKSGIASARRWYWRQSMKTVAHLIGAGFRSSPSLMALTVVGGYMLLTYGGSLPERAIVAVLHLRRHHVTPYYTRQEAESYLFWLNSGILMGRLVISLLIGCVVAVVANGKEMVATMGLNLVLVALTGVGCLTLVARHRPDYALAPLFIVTNLANAILIVIGGVIVREIRSAARRPSGA